MSLKQTSAPAVEPIKLAEATRHLRVDDSESDRIIQDLLIPAVRGWCENYTDRQLVVATWEWKIDGFPERDDRPLLLPKSPAVSVSSIQYIDEDGNTQTWAASNYQVDTDSVPARVMPVPEKSWPTTDTDRLNAVTITFLAGYDDGSSPPGSGAVPAPLKHAMLLMLARYYEHRESVVIGSTAIEVPQGAEWLAQPYRVYRM